MHVRVVQVGVLTDFPADKSGVQLLHIGNLSHHISPGDGLLVYEPNEDFSECRCIAACEVISTDPAELRATFDIRATDVIVVPSTRARWRWRTDPYLCPDVERTRAYGLIDIFAKAFNDNRWHERKLQDAVREVFQMDLDRPTLLPQTGEVYLFGSTTRGTKIGKSIDVEKRKKEVENDVGEALEILHRFPTNDYSRAEFTLHLKYAEFRREGEWFDLPAQTIAEIREITTMNF